MSEKLPKKIGCYSVIKSLGKGGMGEVFLAYDPICDRKIAIKCVREDLLKYKNIVKRFLNEAKIAAKLTHPSIIPVYNIHQSEHELYYIMPYAEGQTLKQIIRETRQKEKAGLPPHPIGQSIPSLIRIFLNVCQAISYAHARSILHRDLKPENIIIGTFGEVLLLDWGLAEHIEKRIPESDIPSQNHLTRPGKVVGTLSYMAPERASGEPAETYTDIYALGVILYQILTLRMPFVRKSLEQFRKQMHKETRFDPAELAPNRDIPKHLCDIVDKALMFDPQKRYQSVNHMIEDLEKYIEGTPEWHKSADIDLLNKADFQFQEPVLLSKHLAISPQNHISEWVILAIAKAQTSGNIKIEVEVTVEAHCQGVGFVFSLPEKNLEDGFCLWLGTKTGPGVRFIRSNVEILHFPDIYLQTRKMHHISIEKIDSKVTFFIDDEQIFSYVGHIPMMGSFLGCIYKDTFFSLGNWNISVGAQNAMVWCLSVPDAFLAAKDYDKALFEYARIANSFKGRVEGREALFRIGITLIEKSKTLKDEEKTNALDKAYQTFEKLHKTSGAPLEYLGKSLVYQQNQEYDEEAKCLELALRKFPTHPLINHIEDHVVFRLHQLAAHNRQGAYYFALIALKHLRHALSGLDTKQLIVSLNSYLEPLYFIEKPGVFLNDQEHSLHLAIQLCFWLHKPAALVEIAQSSLSRPLLENIFFCLLQMRSYEDLEELLRLYPNPEFDYGLMLQHYKPEEALQKLLNGHKIYSSIIKRMILLLMDVGCTPSSSSELLKLAEKVDLSQFNEEESHFIHVMKIYMAIYAKKLKKAKTYLDKHSKDQEVTSPYFAAHTLLSKNFSYELIQVSFPRTHCLIGHYLSNNIDLESGWIQKAFSWEKCALYRQLSLMHICNDDIEKAKEFLMLIKNSH